MDGLAILGGGKIGEALLSGLLRGERKPADIVICEKHDERAAYLQTTYGVRAVEVDEAAGFARTLVVAVKPQDIDTLLAQLHPVVTPQHVVVSVAAGVTTAHTPPKIIWPSPSHCSPRSAGWCACRSPSSTPSPRSRAQDRPISSSWSRR
jgi:pyrroline-5-carboxylate reductase